MISVRSEVQVFPGPPVSRLAFPILAGWLGAIAQLGERVLCKHEVVGSIPSGSTRRRVAGREAPSSWMKSNSRFAASAERALSVIVKRKHIRSPFGPNRPNPAGNQCGRGLTATLSDVFEANGLSIDLASSGLSFRRFADLLEPSADRMGPKNQNFSDLLMRKRVGVDNESDQVP